MSEAFPLLNEFIHFVSERWNIHQSRLKGLEPPWTNDPILATYRFTNIRREDDRVTRYVHNQLLKPNIKSPDLWFLMYVARVFNNPQTLHEIAHILPWTPAKANRMLRVCSNIQKEGHTLFNAAYIVSTHRQACNSKQEYYIGIFNRLWSRRDEIQPRSSDTLETFYTRLKAQNGIGSFMAAQVVADVKHAPPLNRVRDWWTFAHSGPGSRRGMGWLTTKQPVLHWREDAWLRKLQELRAVLTPALAERQMPKLDAQNVQNCLCEFSKYCKVKFAGGRAKQLFRPQEGTYQCIVFRQIMSTRP